MGGLMDLHTDEAPALHSTAQEMMERLMLSHSRKGSLTQSSMQISQLDRSTPPLTAAQQMTLIE
jgi:hypothetical protein